MSNEKSHIQLIIAAVLSLAGIALLFVGMIIAPQGEIHESVLVGFGEIGTFAGSIIGIDYRYKIKNAKDNDYRTNPKEPKRKGGDRRDYPPLRTGKDTPLPDA